MKAKKKRGISPVIATVLLVGMVVVVGLIVFIWFRGFVGESATKNGKNIKLVCEDVDFDADYSGGTLSVVNTGNIPIFQLNLKLEGDKSYSTEEIDDGIEEWGAVGLVPGDTFSYTKSYTNYEKITVIPVLIGTSDKGKKTYVCEGQYGKEIIL